MAVRTSTNSSGLLRLFRLACPPTVAALSRSLAYLFTVQCVLLGPAYAITLFCFVLHSILEQGHSIVSGFISISASLIRKSDRRRESRSSSSALADPPRRTVLINGCTQVSSLHLARALHAAGCRVIACDLPQNWLNPTRFSMAVDEYYTVPRPELGVQEYIRALSDIVAKERVDAFVPVSSAEGVVFDALTKAQLERQGCQCLIPSADHVRRLTNRAAYYELAARCGFRVPLYFRVSSLADILDLYENGTIARHGPFVMTSLRCNNKLKQDCIPMPATVEEFLTNIGEYDSYGCTLLLQQQIPGAALTTSTTVLDGQVIAHTACYAGAPYLFDQAQTASSLSWVQTFIKMYPTKLSGNFIFNFTVSAEDGKLYPEGCIVGVGLAILTFEQESLLGSSMMTDVAFPVTVQPRNARPLYWLYEELWRFLNSSFPTSTASSSRSFSWLWRIMYGREAVFQFSDPLPFVALNHLHLPFLVFIAMVQRRPWKSINYRSGKLRS